MTERLDTIIIAAGQAPEGVIHATHKRINLAGPEFFTFGENGKLVDLVTIERLDQLFQRLNS